MTAVSTAPTVTIRHATTADRDRLLEMVHHFLAATIYAETIDVAHLPVALDQLLTIGVFVVAEQDGALVGMLGGMVYDHFLTNARTANECVWWVEPSARGGVVAKGLLTAFEAWARERGARFIDIGSWNPRLDRWYARLGYAPRERLFVKELT